MYLVLQFEQIINITDQLCSEARIYGFLAHTELSCGFSTYCLILIMTTTSITELMLHSYCAGNANSNTDLNSTQHSVCKGSYGSFQDFFLLIFYYKLSLQSPISSCYQKKNQGFFFIYNFIFTKIY